jgi:hypothetical protein
LADSFPRLYKFLIWIAAVVVVSCLLVAILVFLYPGDPSAGIAARQIHLGETVGEVRQILRDVHSSDGVFKGKKGYISFWADGELWVVTVDNEHVVRIQHSPDTGPFLERTRRTWERNVRELRWRVRKL